MHYSNEHKVKLCEILQTGQLGLFNCLYLSRQVSQIKIAHLQIA